MTLPSELPSRIVVRGTNWVGDTVMSIPALREIRHIFPRSEITLWAPAALEPLLRAIGVAEDVISFDPSLDGYWKRPFRMGRRLAKRFDLAILFQNAFESAFTAWLACVPVRVGFPTDLRGPFLSMAVPLTREIRSKHQVFYYLAIADFLREHYRPDEPKATNLPNCSIEIPPWALERATDLLMSEGIDPTAPLLCLCPGSVNSEAKRWPPAYFSALADLLLERLHGSVIFLGASSETKLIDRILSQMRHAGARNFAGKTDLVTSMAVMQLARMVVSNDTGSAHLAVAASARVVTIFGPTIAGATAPFGPNAHIIQGQAPCAPCRHFRCPFPEHPCMRSVTPQALFVFLQKIMTSEKSETGTG